MGLKRGKVLIPAFTGHPDVEIAFADSGFEVDWALSEDERSLGRWRFDRFDLRHAVMEHAVAEKLPETRVLSGVGVKGHMPITAAMLAHAPLLEAIFIGAAGFDRIDIRAATERGILVFNAPGGNAIGVAEQALGLMLSLTRRIDACAAYSRRTGQWAREFAMTSSPPVSTLYGKTLGLIGLGFIGRQLAARAHAGLGMNVLAYDPFVRADAVPDAGIERVENVDDLLKNADVVSLHVPLSDQTRGLIGARELGLMKRSAFLINTARGPIVNTSDLIAALKSGAIAGAGLDCVDPEPLPLGHELYTTENVIITPHVGGAGREDIERADKVATGLVIDFLDGKGPLGAVNPEALEHYHQRFGSQRA